ncbi:hypothetical protein M8994_20390, partial [Brucella sp. 21LCYQ03]|nr:hypothetical protein [Brucella sp. 21LCYQ03]
VIALFYGTNRSKGVLRSAGWSHCHGGVKTYAELFMNNGLDSIYYDQGREMVTGRQGDRGRFRVVTLRNIAVTGPYMHDARFESLEDVLDHYSDHLITGHGISPFLENRMGTSGQHNRLTVQEKKDIISFLHMLTDTTFLRDERFSNPFLKIL